MRRFFLLFSLLFVLAACSGIADPGSSPPTAASEPVPEPSADGSLGLPAEIISAAEAEHLLLSAIYERTSPSVVNIEALVLGDDGTASDARRGSGFVYDSAGHIVTNAHLVSGADAINVTLRNALVLPAEWLGLDSFSDLAALKIAADELAPLPMGVSADVQVGQRAIVIGNPFGLSSSMTTGIISGLGRTLPSAALVDAGERPDFDNPSIIQMDASISPGNSGGPLLDSRGRVIGLTTATRSDSGGFQGVGFAVPADTIRRVIPELIAKGRVDYAWMGISVMREDGGFGVAGLSAALDLPVERGVLLRGVTMGSPAHRAGLRGGHTLVDLRGEAVCAGGDVIIAINDYHLDDLEDLATYLVQRTQPGDEVKLLVIRERTTHEMALTLESRESDSGKLLDCGAS